MFYQNKTGAPVAFIGEKGAIVILKKDEYLESDSNFYSGFKTLTSSENRPIKSEKTTAKNAIKVHKKLKESDLAQMPLKLVQKIAVTFEIKNWDRMDKEDLILALLQLGK